jgi:hypothetical protein
MAPNLVDEQKKPNKKTVDVQGDSDLPPKKRTRKMSGKLESRKGKDNAEKDIQ